MKITVKQEHIDAGKVQDSKSCPIALAIMDSKTKRYASVSQAALYVAKDADWQHNVAYNPSQKMVKWITDFDTGKPVKPTTFEVRRDHYYED